MSIEKLKEEDFIRVAEKLGVEAAAVKAVQEVETGGRGGFLEDGRPRILFEGHVFWKQLTCLPFAVNPEQYRPGNEDILYPKWERNHYKGGTKEYERLEKALALAKKIGKTPEEMSAVCRAAYRSASYGMFQIMGTNAEVCGYKNIDEFVEAMNRSEGDHLDAFAGFILKNNLAVALRAKDWAKFARGYNGKGYAANQYDVKMQKAYEKYVN